MGSRLSVVFLCVALAVLAGLQYQWIGQVTDAERLRLQRTAREAALDFSEDFSAELRSLFRSLELRPGIPLEPGRLAFRYQTWVDGTMYPRLLRSLYLSSPAGLFRLDPELGIMEPAVWPDKFKSVAEFVERQKNPVQEERRFPGLPHIEEVDAFVMPVGRIADVFRGERTRRDERSAGPSSRGSTDAWVIVEVDRDVIVTEIFPAIVARRFAEFEGQNYRLAVGSEQSMPPDAVFVHGDWSLEDLSTPDYAVGLLNLGGGFQRGRPGLLTRRADPLDAVGTDIGARDTGRPPRGMAGPLISPRSFQDWTVLVKHGAGSIGNAANQFRRRNLAISFGVLVILGIGAATVMISGQRARKLGELQMQFAAGVSHELRTPLSVIQSAAHNLGAGVVRDRQGIEEYAAIVQKEARRLSDMVEQIMTYTETRSGRKRYDTGPIDVEDAVDQAVENTLTAFGEAQIVKRVAPKLPPVLADAPTLARCIQNLLSNAIKYGSREGRARIEIEARHDPSSGTVQVIVTDDGPGVPEADVPYLFHAFHRGSNATTTTPGNGLGLHLVQKMMEAQNGSVTYEPVSSGGARFILTLPSVAMTV